MVKSEQLAGNFVTELLAVAFQRRTIFEIVNQYLKYSYLQTEEEKRLWQFAARRFNATGVIPTYGQLQQNFMNDIDTLELLEQIHSFDVEQDKRSTEQIIQDFEAYIKKMRFLEANDRIAETYNRGEKDKAWHLFVKYAEEFSKFSIGDAQYEAVFADFNERQMKRKSEEYNYRFKVPTGIDELDFELGGENGGPETGEYFLWLGDSGVGKSQCLIQLGIAAARQGYRVAHFQLEGTKKQCLDRYDAAWTGTMYTEMKTGNIEQKNADATDRIINRLKQSDIIVSAVEEFGVKSVADIRRELKEIINKYGEIGVVIIDYLELLDPGDGHNYTPGEERFRQQKISKAMKMIAMEFNVVVHTATQSNNIPEEQKNDPDFVITRAQLNEDRGKARPADALITINCTRDEKRHEIMRLYIDKAREHRGNKVIHICNNFSRARFYDRKRTVENNESDAWSEYYSTGKPVIE